MSNLIAYMAGPIDYMEDKGTGWRDELVKLCAESPQIAVNDITFFNPYLPYKIGKVTIETAQYVHDVNLAALKKANILVGKLMKGQTSVGTPIEFYAVMGKIPMIIMTDLEESVYMKYIGMKATFVKDINEMCLALSKIAEQFTNPNAKLAQYDNRSGGTIGIKL